MQNNFVSLGCPGKLTFGPWQSTTHGGGALDNSICPKKPISLHFKGQPIDPQIKSDSKKSAKWCSACGSWFCIWLFMVLHPAPALFLAKLSYGIYQIRGKSSIKINDMLCEMPWTFLPNVIILHHLQVFNRLLPLKNFLFQEL